MLGAPDYCTNRAMFAADSYERSGLFYLGRPLAPGGGAPLSQPLLYDSRHLLTHGVIVGMTGSGKTGLGAVLLEEAAIDGIPAIAIDPKGDLGNLLLTFPELRPDQFAPWAPPNEDPATLAARAREGLAASGPDAARIGRFASAVERTIYTPGASAGARLSLLRSFEPPPAGADAELARERAVATVSALLALVGLDADPMRSPEHILVTTVLLGAWSQGQALDLSTLLRRIQTPPFDRIGAMDLESVVPGKQRQALALAINNAFASPAFAGFLEGEPLDIGRLLWTREGKPRLSILSIAHLGEAERMFFVTLLLGELVSWMRAQPGTSSLRALLYMDEVFGFFPPVAAPPSKQPMLTLLKQARAYGLGIVLATQNPVDLDYKGLSNTGTWMLGRLQTERDKARVLDGLEGVSAASGAAFDRARLDAALSGLPKRTFLLHDVNESAPVLFETRWALSYLRGPMTRADIARLTVPALPSTPSTSAPTGFPAAPVYAAAPGTTTPSARPLLAPGIEECFLATPAPPGTPHVPHILCRLSAHYVLAGAKLDTWLTPTLVAPLVDDAPAWAQAWVFMQAPAVTSAPVEGASFAALPARASRLESYTAWRKSAAEHVYRDRPLILLTAPALGLASSFGESREAFALRASQAAREARDAATNALREKYRARAESAQRKVAAAEDKLSRARAQHSDSQVNQTLELGSSVLGALFGRRSAVRGAVAAAKRAQRTSRKGDDVERTQALLDTARAALAALEREVQLRLQELAAEYDPARLVIEEKQVTAKKADLRVERLALAWAPR